MTAKALAFGLGVLLMFHAVEASTQAPNKLKRKPASTPTPVPTPVPTATPVTIDQKKFEALYRAGKALELAAFVKAQQDFKVELSIAADHISGPLEASLLAAYKEVDRRADLLATRDSCERQLRDVEATYRSSRAQCERIDHFSPFRKPCFENLQRTYDEGKAQIQRLCAPAMEMTVDEVKKSLREAEAIYLGKQLAPAEAPTPTGKEQHDAKGGRS